MSSFSVNELVEAKHQLQLRRVMARWSRYDLIASARSFCFQVIADRAERTAVIVTTNLPFSEWTQMIPNARLCKALLGSDYGSRSHSGDGNGIVSLPAEAGQREERRKTCRGEMSCGNAGPWKPWKAKSRLPTLSTVLGKPQKTAASHIPTASTTGQRLSQDRPYGRAQTVNSEGGPKSLAKRTSVDV